MYHLTDVCARSTCLWTAVPRGRSRTEKNKNYKHTKRVSNGLDGMHAGGGGCPQGVLSIRYLGTILFQVNLTYPFLTPLPPPMLTECTWVSPQGFLSIYYFLSVYRLLASPPPKKKNINRSPRFYKTGGNNKHPSRGGVDCLSLGFASCYGYLHNTRPRVYPKAACRG